MQKQHVRPGFWLGLALAAVVAAAPALAEKRPEGPVQATPANTYGSQGVPFLQVDDAGTAGVREQGATAAQGGAVALGAGVIPVDGGYLEATRVPPTGSALPGRTGLTVQNLSSAPIWCGLTELTNDLTGIQVDGSPDGVHAGGTFQAGVSAGVPVYCWSRAGQTSPADTRWVEVR